MNIAKQLQDKMNSEILAVQLEREQREAEEQRIAEQNALYEGGLGMLSAGHGRDGPVPTEPGLADAFGVLAE